MSSQDSYFVWAKTNRGDEATRRDFYGDERLAVDRATCIARSSGDDGAVSVWVEDAEHRVVWAAGERAKELTDAGHAIDYHGYVDR